MAISMYPYQEASRGLSEGRIITVLAVSLGAETVLFMHVSALKFVFLCDF